MPRVCAARVAAAFNAIDTAHGFLFQLLSVHASKRHSLYTHLHATHGFSISPSSRLHGRLHTTRCLPLATRLHISSLTSPCTPWFVHCWFGWAARQQRLALPAVVTVSRRTRAGLCPYRCPHAHPHWTTSTPPKEGREARAPAGRVDLVFMVGRCSFVQTWVDGVTGDCWCGQPLPLPACQPSPSPIPPPPHISVPAPPPPQPYLALITSLCHPPPLCTLFPSTPLCQPSSAVVRHITTPYPRLYPAI